MKGVSQVWWRLTPQEALVLHGSLSLWVGQELNRERSVLDRCFLRQLERLLERVSLEPSDQPFRSVLLGWPGDVEVLIHSMAFWLAAQKRDDATTPQPIVDIMTRIYRGFEKADKESRDQLAEQEAQRIWTYVIDPITYKVAFMKKGQLSADQEKKQTFFFSKQLASRAAANFLLDEEKRHNDTLRLLRHSRLDLIEKEDHASD